MFINSTPRVVTLCGSTRFKDKFEEVNRDLTLKGMIVLSVGSFVHAEKDITESQKIGLDELHRRKIDISDEIYVINVGGYIGESTRNEIEYADRTNKTVVYLELNKI